MDNRYYNILGVSPSATNEEIEMQYQTLKAKYQKERFLEGEVGNNAAKMLTEIENAYNEIMAYRNMSDTSTFGAFSQVENAIRSGNLQKAQEILDSFDERDSEWHYYQSVIFYKKSWINESKKQLEIAIEMSPNEQKYKNALNKINAKINGQNNSTYNPDWNKSGNAYRSGRDSGEPVQQLGGDSCCQWCCDMIACNLLFNLCCGCR